MEIKLLISEDHDIDTITINNKEYTLDDYDQLPWLQEMWDEMNSNINLIP